MFEYVIRVSLHYAAQQHCAKMLRRKANYINCLLLENYPRNFVWVEILKLVEKLAKIEVKRAKDFIFNFYL